MQKSTTPFLLISCFLLLVSCASHELTKGYATQALQKNTYEVPYFLNPQTDYVYKANISVYGNELSGIFIAKKINETTHRVVFTTEFGNKLLDFEISETQFKVNSIVSELDKKILINTLKSDFRLLLRSQYNISKQFENTEDTIYQSQAGNKYYYLFTSKPDNKLYKIVEASKRKEKINLSFTSENNIFAQRIIIQHYNIKLRIEFNFFKPQSN